MIGIPRVPLLLPALACLCFAAMAQPAAAVTFTPAGQAAIDKLTGIGLIRRR